MRLQDVDITHILVDMGQWNSTRDRDAALVLFLEDDVWWLLVDSDPKPFQFGLDNLLVCQRLVDIQNNENEVAGFGDSDDLSSTSFTILGSLNDTRQIKNLNLSSIVNDLAGDGRQRSKLVRRSYGTRQL